MMNNYKVYKRITENKNPITLLINYYTSEIKNKENITDYEINDGWCDWLSNKVISNLKDKNIYDLSTSQLMSKDIDILDYWGGKDAVIFTNKGYFWSKESLKFFGYPPVKDITRFEPKEHVWIYDSINRKHYDAEVTQGVYSIWELHFFIRYFN